MVASDSSVKSSTRLMSMALLPGSTYTVGVSVEFRCANFRSTVCTRSPSVSVASRWSMDHCAAIKLGGPARTRRVPCESTPLTVEYDDGLMTKSALWPGLVVKSKLVFTSAPIVSRPRYVRSKSRFSEPTRLKLLASRSTEAVAWKHNGGSKTLFSLAPSA